MICSTCINITNPNAHPIPCPRRVRWSLGLKTRRWSGPSTLDWQLDQSVDSGYTGRLKTGLDKNNFSRLLTESSSTRVVPHCTLIFRRSSLALTTPPQVPKAKQASFKPVNANFDIDIGSFSQPILRRLAHYYLHMPLYVCLLFVPVPLLWQICRDLLFSCRQQMTIMAVWKYASLVWLFRDVKRNGFGQTRRILAVVLRLWGPLWVVCLMFGRNVSTETLLTAPLGPSGYPL